MRQQYRKEGRVNKKRKKLIERKREGGKRERKEGRKGEILKSRRKNDG